MSKWNSRWSVQRWLHTCRSCSGDVRWFASMWRRRKLCRRPLHREECVHLSAGFSTWYRHAEMRRHRWMQFGRRSTRLWNELSMQKSTWKLRMRMFERFLWQSVFDLWRMQQCWVSMQSAVQICRRQLYIGWMSGWRQVPTRGWMRFYCWRCQLLRLSKRLSHPIGWFVRRRQRMRRRSTFLWLRSWMHQQTGHVWMYVSTGLRWRCISWTVFGTAATMCCRQRVRHKCKMCSAGRMRLSATIFLGHKRWQQVQKSMRTIPVRHQCQVHTIWSTKVHVWSWFQRRPIARLFRWKRMLDVRQSMCVRSTMCQSERRLQMRVSKRNDGRCVQGRMCARGRWCRQESVPQQQRMRRFARMRAGHMHQSV